MPAGGEKRGGCGPAHELSVQAAARARAPRISAVDTITITRHQSKQYSIRTQSSAPSGYSCK
eukprot:2898782-Pyramimonas_sp.AAC.4